MRQAIARFPIISFTTIAIAISWAIWLPLLTGSAVPRRSALLLYYAGVIGPTAAALLCSGRRPILNRISRWRVPVTWFGVAVILPFLIRAIAVAAAVGWNIELRPIESIARTTALMVLLVPFEEIGWRGYLLPIVQRRYSPLASSVVVGLIWALWHTPLAWAKVGYQQSGQPWHYMLWFTASILPISCLATWLFNGSGQSIAVVTLFHIVVNLADFVVVLPRASGESVLLSTTVITTFVAGVIFWRDRHLGLRTGPDGAVAAAQTEKMPRHKMR
jgi:membrane protease YdiL (CAAX protease family)